MNPEDLTKDKVNQETSKIAWSELQRFFAQGLAVNVTPDLDLVEVADAFSKDDKVRVEHRRAMLPHEIQGLLSP